MKAILGFALSALLLAGCVSKPPQPSAQMKKDPHAGMNMPKDMGDQQNSGDMKGALDLDGMMASLPSGWTRQQPSSSMRAAQIAIAAAPGDNEGAELAVFFFPGSGGSAMANIERWQGQMKGPHGEPGSSVAKTDTMMVGLLTVITTDITGTLLGSAAPMMGGNAQDKPNQRMVASVIQTPSGNWFIKVTGPIKTVTANEKNIRDFLKKAKVSGLANS